MKLLLTGATGFIGSHLAPRLAAQHELATWSRPSVDLLRPLPAIDADAVVHLAAQADVAACAADPAACHALNAEATQRLASACQDAGAHLVLGSSILVHPQLAGDLPEASLAAPAQHPYGASKHAAEEATLAAGGTVLRLANVYGPGQQPRAVIPAIIRQVTDPHATEVRLHSLAPQRDFVWVGDVVAAFEAACLRRPGGVCQIASGQSVAIGDVAREAVVVAGRELRVVGEQPGGPEPGFSLATLRAGDVLGWRAATPLADGLRRLLPTPQAT